MKISFGLTLMIVCLLWGYSNAELRTCANHDGYSAVDSCGQTNRLCESGFFAALDTRGCLVTCQLCENFTYTEGPNNCTDCIPCGTCTKGSEEFEACSTLCFGPTEKPITCSPLPEETHGEYNCTDGIFPSSVCSLSCHERFVGDAKVTCLETGDWSNGQFPKCIAHVSGLNIKFAVIIGAVALALVIVLLICGFVCFCKCMNCLCFKDDYSKVSQKDIELERPSNEMKA